MKEKVKLPAPDLVGTVTVEQALAARRSVRSYAESSLTLAEVGQLLWAAQGITAERGRRTAPSAGATYPLELFVVAGDVDGLEPGIYRYLPAETSLSLVRAGDAREAVCEACLSQSMMATAPVSFVFASVVSRTARRYGGRAERYVAMEIGHAAENLHLQCVGLGLGTVCVGAFDDAGLKRALGIREAPMYVMPVGRVEED